MLFITNRIIDFSVTNITEIYQVSSSFQPAHLFPLLCSFQYFQNPSSTLCVDMTIILTARNEATKTMLFHYYSNITKNLFVVPDLNCINNLVGCITPCVAETRGECAKKPLSTCDAPTKLPTTTIATTSGPVSRGFIRSWFNRFQTEQYTDSVYIMYIFSFSTLISLDTLSNIRDHLIGPINDYHKVS